MAVLQVTVAVVLKEEATAFRDLDDYVPLRPGFFPTKELVNLFMNESKSAFPGARVDVPFLTV